MADAPRTLYRSAGSFLRVRGTDRFVHYSRFFPHQLQSDTEFWELCGIRLMRQALANAQAAGEPPIDVVGVEQTLSMLCGAVIAQVLDAAPPGRAVVFGNCTIAMELEALKLLRPGRPGQALAPVDLVLGGAAPEETRTLAHFLHQEIDERASDYPVRSIRPGPLRVEDVAPDAALLVLNHARVGVEDGPAALRMAAEYHRNSGVPVLVLLRTTEQAPWTGTGVSGVRVEAPSHYALLDALGHDGVRGVHAFVEGFDRDFLLPPNEGCGLGIVLLSDGAAAFKLSGFRPFPGPVAVEGRELVGWGGAERWNYARSLNWELPDIAHPPEWDWQAFKREHDDALDAETLAEQPSRAVGGLLAGVVSTMTDQRRQAFPRHGEAVRTVVRLCDALELPWGGALQLAQVANTAGESGLAWQAVTNALLDLGRYGMTCDAAFRRVETVFGSLLLNLENPVLGLEVAETARRRAGGDYAAVQLAALRGICALRCGALQPLLMSAGILLRDPDWVLTAELTATYARHRMAGTSPAEEIAALTAERALSARERALLSLMD